MPTGNTQQIINYGASANDGQGDPLRTAFIKTDDNFGNIWDAGPVGSNIKINNNAITSIDTNGNIFLAPQGVGVIEAGRPIIPRINNVYDLGTSALNWRTLYVNELQTPSVVTNAVSSGACIISGILTPAAMTANTNDWNPVGMSAAMVLRISSTTSIDLTGIVAPSPAVNQLWYVYNVGTEQIAFINDSGLSSVGNRFLFGNNRTLQANEGLVLWYDVDSAGWRSPGVQN